MAEQTRRQFLRSVAALSSGAALLALPPGCRGAARKTVPSYLKDHAMAYATDPRAAAIEWFRAARFGLFIHYGLYSLLGRHEWVQLREKIPVAEYARLKDRFTAKKFDADVITDLAAEAEMTYVNLVTRHHDSFCLWDTKQSDFSSVNSPAKRDLVGEMAEQCAKKGLGFFCYYSHGRDWRHPHAPNNDEFPRGSARPKYDEPQPEYARGKDHDLQKYLDFMQAQITELLTGYGPIAGIWLDGIAVPENNDPGKFKCRALYDHIRRCQPQVLVSYKQGLLDTEDFYAPEHYAVPKPGNKPMEICTTLQKGGWGYVEGAEHLTADDLMQRLAWAAHTPANLLANTGPLGDGSIHPADVATLREVGRRLRADGFPAAVKPPSKPSRPKKKPKKP